MLLPIETAPSACVLVISIVPAPVVAELIEITSSSAEPPITPCIAMAPAPVLIVKSRGVPSELTVAVELKVTLVLFASASMVMSPAKVTGPVKLIAPSAVLVEIRLFASDIPLSPIRVIEPELTVEPRVMLPLVPVPSSRIKASSVPALLIAPVIEISPPALLISNVPSAITTALVIVIFALARSTAVSAAEKVVPVLAVPALIAVVPPNL